MEGAGNQDKESYIRQRRSQIRLLLLPEEVDTEILHQRREHICNVLQDLRPFMQGIGKLAIGVQHFGRSERTDHAAADGC